MSAELKKFIDAQKSDFQIALAEIKRGRKESHWMWYIFPQLSGLGHSETAKYYSIKSLKQAKEFLDHEILGKHLMDITRELLNLDKQDPEAIFGSPDHMKLKSSMTLFSLASGKSDNIFNSVLLKYFNGEPDGRTRALLGLE